MYLTLKHPTRKCALDRHLVPSDICSVDQVCLKKRKKNEGEQNQATLTEQVWSIRDGKKGQKRNFSCVTNTPGHSLPFALGVSSSNILTILVRKYI